MNDFVHLHCHSNFSLLDGLIKIPELFKKLKRLNQSAIAITDHGNCASIFDAQAEAKKNGIKYIPGCEVYSVPDAKIKSKDERSSETDISRKHLILLAKNNEGYKRLIKIASWGCTEGYYYRPRIDDSVLEKYGTEGLIASSACFVPSKYLTIITKSDIKNLLDVNITDQVKTHTGKWKQVINPTVREYEGNFYTIYTANNFPMTVTENHKFLILRNNAKKINDNYNYLKPWYINNLNNLMSWTERYRGEYIPEWVEVQNIKKNDFLLYPININNINIKEARQYILSQIDKFILGDDLYYHLQSTDLNYICNLRDKLNQLLVFTCIYDRNDYYELKFLQKKLEQIKNNCLYPLNMGEIPFEFEGKLYIRTRVYDIEQFYDKKLVHCLNIEDDHSFVINNIISHNCFVPNDNLDVLTKDGIKNLLDVNTIDQVQSHTGKWKRVIIPTTRKYKGKFYTINIHNNMPLTVTENHKFFILRNNIVQQIEAKNLKVNDYCITSINEETYNIDCIHLNKNIQVSYHPFKSYEINLDNDFIQFIALYIQYGSISENKQIKFIINNIEYQQLLVQIIDKLFNIKPQIEKQQSYNIYWYNCLDLYQNLLQWFYNDDNNIDFPQKLPRFLKFLPRDKQLFFIQQLLKKQDLYFFYKQISYDILFILNRLYINSTLELLPNNIFIINISQIQYEQIIDNNISNINVFEWNNKKYLKYPIQSISSFYDEKQVYCLNVEDDHSFTICNIKVCNCIAGSISQYILRGQYDKAKKKALYYQQLFNGDFYLEIMPHLNKQIDVNKGLIQLSKDTGIKLIITSDAHYLNKEDKEAHEVLLAVQTRTTINDPNRWKFEPGYYYIMGREELAQIMKEQHSYISEDILNEAMNNTVKIAEQCNVEFNFGKHYLPKIDPYKELQSDPQLLKEFNTFETRRLLEVAKRNNISMEEAQARLDVSNEMVRFLCIHGYNGLYKQSFLDKRHLSLFLYELDTIISMGFASYFLILYEIQLFCSKAQILVGCSRGCFTKNNKVKTLLKDFINIDQIEKNDQVLGFDHKYHKVLKKYIYNCNEDLIQIKTENNIINGITKDHKVLGLKKEEYIKDKKYIIDDLKWYNINELQEGDYLIQIE